MRVLGLDPGLRITGWGIVDVHGSIMAHVANGSCKSSGKDIGERLASLFEQISAVVREFEPDEASVEKTFVNSNYGGSLSLGHARAVAIVAASRTGIPISEYAPNAVKKIVTGVGHADKSQVEQMVSMQLPGAKISGTDASDALAVAVAHAVTQRFMGNVEAAVDRAGSAK